MKKLYTIGFLNHSGFYVELEDCILIFDYYQDPEQRVDSLLAETTKKVYFFVSHMHFDHFNPEISRFSDKVEQYFIHKDCILPEENLGKVCFMSVGEIVVTSTLEVNMFGSTDIGGSFWIEHKDITLFHAGDLNWWHWSGAGDRDNLSARTLYFRELKKFIGKQVDLLFFPVDARQEVAREWGVRQFMEVVKVKKLLIPMHASGEKWHPSYSFIWRFPDVPIWVPSCDGEVYRGDM